MKENFPNLVMEIDMQVQEAQSIPNKMGAKKSTSRNITIKIAKVKDNLKSSKIKTGSYLQQRTHKTQLISQKKVCRLEGFGKTYSKS